MTMGERIRRARVEAGLSQRVLAGTEMTRNMLSALEHDSAKPSVGTLIYLSEKLHKPVGYFFGEDGVSMESVERITQARNSFLSGAYQKCLDMTLDLDSAFQPEGTLLRMRSLLGLAEQAIRDGRIPYGKSLLEQCRIEGEKSVYFGLVERNWIGLMALAGELNGLDSLLEEDDMLLLRAESALVRGKYSRAAALLEAVENREEKWQFLRAEVYFHQHDYEKAVEHYQKTGASVQEKTDRRLEICYREMGDFKLAYYYATKRETR